MSVESIHLRKLLTLFYATPQKRRALLRADIREELRRQNGDDQGGGDFHAPFWADAKEHVAGITDLRERVATRIDSNKGRERLYPRLAEGFLEWWEEHRRWRNEPFELLPQAVRARFPIAELGVVVKVENLLAFKVATASSRIIYPYFSEEPVLSDEGARLGLWLMSVALPDFVVGEMRILDVLRGASFGELDVGLQGNESELFLQRYEYVLKEREDLQIEYA